MELQSQGRCLVPEQRRQSGSNGKHCFSVGLCMQFSSVQCCENNKMQWLPLVMVGVRVLHMPAPYAQSCTCHIGCYCCSAEHSDLAGVTQVYKEASTEMTGAYWQCYAAGQKLTSCSQIHFCIAHILYVSSRSIADMP